MLKKEKKHQEENLRKAQQINIKVDAFFSFRLRQRGGILPVLSVRRQTKPLIPIESEDSNFPIL